VPCKINNTIAAIRQNYWMPAARKCVKKVVRQCKKYSGTPYKAPDPPPSRVQPTGVDFTCEGQW